MATLWLRMQARNPCAAKPACYLVSEPIGQDDFSSCLLIGRAYFSSRRKVRKSRPGPPISASGSGGPGPPYPNTLSAHWRGSALPPPRRGGARPPLVRGYWIPGVVLRRDGLETRKALWWRWCRNGSGEGFRPHTNTRMPLQEGYARMFAKWVSRGPKALRGVSKGATPL